MLVGALALGEGQRDGGGGSRDGRLLEQLAFRRCGRRLSTSKLPSARPFSTVDAAEEDGAGFAGHAKVVTSRQVTIQPIPHNKTSETPDWSTAITQGKCRVARSNALAATSVFCRTKPSVFLSAGRKLWPGEEALILTKMR